MSAELITGPMEAKPIVELYAWIGVDLDGGEGILSADLPMFDDYRHTPLITSRKELAKRMEPVAVQIQTTAQQNGQFIKVELRTYVLKPK